MPPGAVEYDAGDLTGHIVEGFQGLGGASATADVGLHDGGALHRRVDEQAHVDSVVVLKTQTGEDRAPRRERPPERLGDLDQLREEGLQQRTGSEGRHSSHTGGEAGFHQVGPVAEDGPHHVLDDILRDVGHAAVEKQHDVALRRLRSVFHGRASTEIGAHHHRSSRPCGHLSAAIHRAVIDHQDLAYVRSVFDQPHQ